MLGDGTLAECDRVGDGSTDYSRKHMRHGVNAQVTEAGAREVVLRLGALTLREQLAQLESLADLLAFLRPA